MSRIMIIDQPDCIASISNALNNDQHVVIAKSSHLTSALEIVHKLAPDIIILKLQFIQSNIPNGIETIKRLAPQTKLLVTHPTFVHLNSKLPPKVEGLISNAYLEEELTFALNTINTGNFYLSPMFTNKLINNRLSKPDYSNPTPHPEHIISERELEVLQLILKEYSNQEIAEALFISRRTVEVHKRNLIIKTNSKNIVGLVLYSLKNGLLHLADR